MDRDIPIRLYISLKEIVQLCSNTHDKTLELSLEYLHEYTNVHDLVIKQEHSIHRFIHKTWNLQFLPFQIVKKLFVLPVLRQKSKSLQSLKTITVFKCICAPVKYEYQELLCMSFLFSKNCNYQQYECIYYLNKCIF